MRNGFIVRLMPVVAFAAFSGITAIFALGEGLAPVTIALAGSTIVFIVGVVIREADIVYLAWLDQGSNLLLVEVQSSSATILTITATVVCVLVLADLAHLLQLFGRYGLAASLRSFLTQSSRLILVGLASGVLTLVGIAFSPVVTVTSGQALVVAVLAIGALAVITIAGTADR